MEAKTIIPTQILDAAIDRLHRMGWKQKDFGDRQGPNCAIGAMWWGMYDSLGIDHSDSRKLSAEDRLCYQVVEHAVRDVLDPDRKLVSIATWNDKPERTVEDVVLAFKHARYELETADEN